LIQSSSRALETAIAAAREAGAIALDRINDTHSIEEKGRRADIVTEVDRACEAVIIARIKSAFPHAAILAEESGAHPSSGGSQTKSVHGDEERWIIDPIDGTTNYAHGYPIFCISIAYERAGELIAGVVYAPAMSELFVAERGSGARCNDRPIHVSTIDAVGDALICTGFHPSNYERNAPYFRAASNRAQAVRRDGAAALDLAYIACGRYDGFWEWGLHAWDVAAGTLIIEEAGGRVTRIDGTSNAVDAASILATNGAVHDELSEILKL
jgi:myo-inositol-1(or 4)-monophosphatase